MCLSSRSKERVDNFEDRRNERRCSLLWRRVYSTTLICFFPQRTHLFSGSNTVRMLICLAQKFPIYNPSPAGLVSFVGGPDSVLILSFGISNTFWRLNVVCFTIFKFNTIFKRARPHVVNIIVGGTNRNWRIIILTSVCTYRKRENWETPCNWP